MAKTDYIALLGQGVTHWNQWREQNPTARPDLRKANLQGANLSRANFALTNLSGANLSNAILARTVFTEAKLKRTDFSRSTLFHTTFGDVDLGSAIGLDSVIHHGPSVIGVDTLSRSKSLPLAFLRGAGVPDNLIAYLPSLLGQAIQFYSCFISYSSKDQAFADRLHADLQNNGVRCWFAPVQLAPGRRIHDQIDEAIRLYDKLLLILSPNSMKSDWVKREIAAARNREKQEKTRLLFPISLVPFETIRQWRAPDPDSGEDLAREVREYKIPDFSHWTEPDAYSDSFLALLRNLTSSPDDQEDSDA